MVPFYTRCPAVAWQEMRSVSVRGLPPLPNGDDGLLERSGAERDGDCRRVISQGLSSSTGSSVWATINYGWETRACYEHWLGDTQLAHDCQGPELDPLNAQSRYSAALLELFESVRQESAYVERLQRHYALFKARTPAHRKPVGSRKHSLKRKRHSLRVQLVKDVENVLLHDGAAARSVGPSSTNGKSPENGLCGPWDSQTTRH